jgi:glycosyltransferase involved in cell wall biosynthesis
MKMVHIHARDIVHHDAVGSFCRQSAMLLERAGYGVRLWAEHTNVDAPHAVSNRRDFAAALSPDDIVFFNHSIYDPQLDDLLALPNRKLVYFHNITAPELIDPEDATTVENCRRGLEQCRRLAEFDGLLANSTFTADTLLTRLDVGAANRWREHITICPPIIGADRWADIAAAPIVGPAQSLSGLFVGRLVPHKGPEDILEIFAHLAARSPAVNLTIVGGPVGGSYVEMLKEKAGRIAASHPGFQVEFRTGISDEDLKGIYEATDFCIAHSTHEGFCVPALDSLSFDKPMFVAPQPAVLEVLGEAALVVPHDDHEAAALAIAEFFLDREAPRQHDSVRRKRLAELKHLADGHLILEALRKVEGL